MAPLNRKPLLVSAGLGLAILAFINLFNYLDRYVVSALFESLKASELRLSDAQLGSLMSAFLIVYTFAAPVFGALGDRRGRPRLIAFGVFLWSLATALSGLAGSFLALVAARGSVGIGEAAYGTIAPSLLSDYYPAARRGRVMAIFFCAIPVGSALGYVLGGLVDQHFGWRAAFFVAGGPGLLLAALCLLLRDPLRGSQDVAAGATTAPGAPAAPSVTTAPRGATGPGAATTPRGPSAPDEPPTPGAPTAPGLLDPSLGPATRRTYRGLLGNRPYVLTILGYAAYTFAVGGLAAWMPAFLERVRGMPRAEATVSFGAIIVITGFTGTFIGGWVGDWCAKYSKAAFLWLCSVSALVAAPFVWAALTTVSPARYLVYMVIAQLLIFLSTGPVNAAIVNSVKPLERASAVAFGIFSIHIFGDAISPWLIGVISDAASLASAVLIVPAAVVLCALIWAWAARAESAA
jgi:MFS family permease